jgi:hypothetical protein
MELLHIYSDGSRLFRISARALTQIPIWKGNRILDMEHVRKISTSITHISVLDSGYKIIQYMEEDGDYPSIRRSYIIDGQHRISVVKEYFEMNTLATDFPVTVTEISVHSEADAISYFNQINNVKPIQFEKDDNMIINQYIEKIINVYCPAMRLIRTGSTKRPYLSVDKFRLFLQKHIHALKKLTVDTFIERCQIMNQTILDELRIRVKDPKEKEVKLLQKMIELEFALAWDDKFNWLHNILN